MKGLSQEQKTVLSSMREGHTLTKSFDGKFFLTDPCHGYGVACTAQAKALIRKEMIAEDGGKYSITATGKAVMDGSHAALTKAGYTKG